MAGWKEMTGRYLAQNLTHLHSVLSVNALRPGLVKHAAHYTKYAIVVFRMRDERAEVRVRHVRPKSAFLEHLLLVLEVVSEHIVKFLKSLNALLVGDPLD